MDIFWIILIILVGCVLFGGFEGKTRIPKHLIKPDKKKSKES